MLVKLFRKVLSRHVQRNTEQFTQTVNEEFKSLTKEVDNQIKYLDDNPHFTKDEKRVQNKLKKSLNASKRTIKKGVKDIEDRLQ